MNGKKQQKLGRGSVSKVSVESIGSYFHVEGKRHGGRLKLQETERTEVMEQ